MILQLLQNKKVSNAIIYYLSIMLVILVVKPAMFFHNNKVINTIGMNKKHKSILPLPMFISVISICVFFLSHYLS